MADARITCITKPNPNSKYEGITHVGGEGWYWARERVIQSIENKTNTFHTLVNGNRSEVGVVNGQNGKYLRTYADSDWDDNLLSLPQCK